jgi:glucose-6-phosphate 1-dehydrogenase
MNNLRSGALGFFGATGDLDYKKIFPSLQRSPAEIRRRSAIAEIWRELWTKLPANLIICCRHRACGFQR